MQFTLMQDHREYHVMHEECGRIADPPLRYASFPNQWRSIAAVTDMPTLLQRELTCGWCQRSLSAPADQELTGA